MRVLDHISRREKSSISWFMASYQLHRVWKLGATKRGQSTRGWQSRNTSHETPHWESMGRLSLESAMEMQWSSFICSEGLVPLRINNLDLDLEITLHTTSTHPWESSHLRVPWGNTNTPSAHPWAGSRLRVPWEHPWSTQPLIWGTALTWWWPLAWLHASLSDRWPRPPRANTTALCC